MRKVLSERPPKTIQRACAARRALIIEEEGGKLYHAVGIRLDCGATRRTHPARFRIVGRENRSVARGLEGEVLCKRFGRLRSGPRREELRSSSHDLKTHAP